MTSRLLGIIQVACACSGVFVATVLITMTIGLPFLMCSILTNAAFAATLIAGLYLMKGSVSRGSKQRAGVVFVILTATTLVGEIFPVSALMAITIMALAFAFFWAKEEL